MAEVSSKVHVPFFNAFPKREVYSVDTCQFDILREGSGLHICCIQFPIEYTPVIEIEAIKMVEENNIQYHNAELHWGATRKKLTEHRKTRLLSFPVEYMLKCTL